MQNNQQPWGRAEGDDSRWPDVDDELRNNRPGSADLFSDTDDLLDDSDSEPDAITQQATKSPSNNAAKSGAAARMLKASTPQSSPKPHTTITHQQAIKSPVKRNVSGSPAKVLSDPSAVMTSSSSPMKTKGSIVSV